MTDEKQTQKAAGTGQKEPVLQNLPEVKTATPDDTSVKGGIRVQRVE